MSSPEPNPGYPQGYDGRPQEVQSRPLGAQSRPQRSKGQFIDNTLTWNSSSSSFWMKFSRLLMHQWTWGRSWYHISSKYASGRCNRCLLPLAWKYLSNINVEVADHWILLGIEKNHITSHSSEIRVLLYMVYESLRKEYIQKLSLSNRTFAI